MKPLLLSIAFLFFHFATPAQSVITVAGDYVEDDDLSVSWTLGEVVTEALNQDNITLSQGQQQFTVSLISGIGQKYDFAVTAYPNPTKNALSVTFSNDEKNNLILNLYNSLGVEIHQQGLTSDQKNTIPMTDYPAGVYIITIKCQQELLKTFRIIKQ